MHRWEFASDSESLHVIDTLADSSADVDDKFMRQALALAAKGWGQTAPNPMVGAVVVARGRAVGEGFHQRYGEPHAETFALRAAGAASHGATLYVTLEPCAHHGKTPPCVDAVIAAGVSRAVIAARDPSAIARGGIEKLRAGGVRVDVGVERDAALELNAPFFNAHTNDLPWVTLKLAISRDGAIADPSRAHRWITGEESRAEVHRLRANADAVAVGVGTVLADDPTLTVRDAPPPRVPPRRVVFDSTLRTPPSSVVVRTARDVPTTVVTTEAGARSAARGALERSGVDILTVPVADDGRSLDLRAALRALRERELRSLFVESGPTLSGALLRESLVHRVLIFQSPLVMGPKAPRAFASAPADFEERLRLLPVVERRPYGNDLMTSYALRDVPCSPD